MESFLSKENFKLAFKRLQTSQRNLYKELYAEDLEIFGFSLEHNIEAFIHEIKNKVFSPDKSFKIFQPKKDNLVRPISLLKFKDLLIYQALINVIAESIYDEIIPYYNTIVFGNVITNPKDPDADNRIFFYKKWKYQWKKFTNKTKEYYENGYNFVSEFDIASFFDTIDHGILCQILDNKYNIDKDLLDILETCLIVWTGDSNHPTFERRHGIPQGPIASAFLADLYLLHLDLEFKTKARKLDTQYIRYVDDIRIFSRDKITGQKSIAYLDLLARDLGLIPQASKILIHEITDLNKLLKHQESKFSAIAREHKAKQGVLKSKTHKKLKKRFLDCFDENSDEQYLDKTIISFALYKLNSDPDIKAVILKHYEKIYTHFSAVLFYLRKHFSEDEEIRYWLINLLKDENLLFQHISALILKNFPDLPFMEDLYERHIEGDRRNWLLKYFMFRWLYENKKYEIIISHSLDDNYFLIRELNKFKSFCTIDDSYNNIFTRNLMKNKDSLIALQGLYFRLGDLCDITYDDAHTYNSYIQYQHSNRVINYTGYALKEDFRIENPENFFREEIWTDTNEYDEINQLFFRFNRFRKIDPSLALITLNSFNNLVYDKICQILSINKKDKDYGVNLDAGYITSKFPITNNCFMEINDKRNQNTEAHPYNKHGDIRVRIKFKELGRLIEKERRALDEICLRRL
ncbi:RNA-directed DNA polymerase [Leptolyngbyaceae cyanobacterium CCMR0082]|uniref:RNA-directed DNA polymerase n=2 Tax=Adonisia TaxID=2950183 RepID=A0A6M0SJ55_9CYAN|nr:RNA-directed DNA polymerase [Adonisia turfae CCMR0082]